MIQIAKIPEHLRLAPGQKMIISVNFPLRFHGLEKEASIKTLFKQDVILNSFRNRKFDIELKLFGKIPVKQMHIEIATPPKVIPCGQAIGVVLSTRGVVIVGHLPVVGIDQKKYYPAKQAGLIPGDIVLELNNCPINHVEEVEHILRNSHGKILKISVKRKGKIVKRNIQPVLTQKGNEQRYMLGLFIEDPAAGVGTLTFYNSKTRGFGGLGHQITNFGGNKGINFQQGEIVLANINGIRAGFPGKPGEKIGVFNSSQNPIGTIQKNCRFGIYGTMSSFYSENIEKDIFKPVSIGYASEIKEGAAEIYTVINGTHIEKFKVKIIKVYRQRIPRDKGLIIRVTDPRLLKLTGGIIQGMSGSPVIQGGKLVGAVTHVFVNDPTKGYGVLAEWMIQELNSVTETGKAS